MLERMEIAPNIYHINESLDVFVTLIVGSKRALLIDTGFGINDIKTCVEEITSLPITVVNTHGHIDHINGNYRFDEVYLHESDFNVASEHSQEQWKTTAVNLYKDYHGSLPKEFNKEEYLKSGAGNIKPLTMDAIDLGGIVIEPIHTPGHSAGCISYYLPYEQMVFTGDGANGNVYMFLPTSTSIKTYIESLNTLLNLDIMSHVFSHYYAPLPASRLQIYKNCALNIDTNKSRKIKVNMLPYPDPMLYVHKERLEPSKYKGKCKSGYKANKYACVYYSVDKLI